MKVIGEYEPVVMYTRAIEVATAAHRGQIDKSGLPVILHPLRVAAIAVREAAALLAECEWSSEHPSAAHAPLLVGAVAVLHDTVEDTSLGISEIRNLFTPQVADVVELLTHPDGLSYDDYVNRIAACPIARFVKLADLRDNQDRPEPKGEEPDKRIRRVFKHIKAGTILTNLGQLNPQALLSWAGLQT